ncbi:MAG: hypothetical protein IH599_04835, partial [Bacteroidales bacterium]|nr:hypothetical protein [Bacteroidales bacterium]
MDGVVRYSGPGNDPSKIISNLIGLTGSTAITSIYISPVPDGILGFACGQNFLDHRDGQVYPTVTIGTQCWMAANLNIGIMVNSISNGTSHSDQSNNGIIEKYCYNNDPAYCDTFGGLYDWNEMMG